MPWQSQSYRTDGESIGEEGFIRNGGLRVKHQSNGCGCKNVYQTVSWEVMALSLRDVKEQTIGVKGLSIFGCLDSKEVSLLVLNT